MIPIAEQRYQWAINRRIPYNLSKPISYWKENPTQYESEDHLIAEVTREYRTYLELQ